MDDLGANSDPGSWNRSAEGLAPSRTCIHCGEWFYDPGDPTRAGVAPKVIELTVTSRRGVVAGLVVAFAIPVSYWLLATLVEHGIAPYDQTHALLNPLFEISLLEVLLGPVGIGVALWSGGIRGAFAMAGLTVVAIPVLAVVWFLAVATLSGALGNPFDHGWAALTRNCCSLAIGLARSAATPRDIWDNWPPGVMDANDKDP